MSLNELPEEYEEHLDKILREHKSICEKNGLHNTQTTYLYSTGGRKYEVCYFCHKMLNEEEKINKIVDDIKVES